MKIHLRLADDDWQRYGFEPDRDWLVLDPYAVEFDETIVLQKGVEVEGITCSFDSAQDWRAALGKGDAFAGKVLVWLALRRAGVKVSLAELNGNADGLMWRVENEATDAGEPGKDPSTPETTS